MSKIDFTFVFQNYFMQTIKTIQPTFDIFKALYVIEHDADLNEIFRDGKKDISFNALRSFAKLGTLPQETVDKVNEIFELIICKTKKLLNTYNKVTIEEIQNNTKPPKHYGKKRILQDIQNNQGKSELDRAMLALNDMRNIYSKLKSRCIKDKLNEQHILTRSDYRDIVAIVRILENKVSHILSKK